MTKEDWVDVFEYREHIVVVNKAGDWSYRHKDSDEPRALGKISPRSVKKAIDAYVTRKRTRKGSPMKGREVLVFTRREPCLTHGTYLRFPLRGEARNHLVIETGGAERVVTPNAFMRPGDPDVETVGKLAWQVREAKAAWTDLREKLGEAMKAADVMPMTCYLSDADARDKWEDDLAAWLDGGADAEKASA